MMKIKIDELQRAFNIIMDNIQEQNGASFEVEVKEDYFWHVLKDELYKVSEQPNDFTIGSLHDDILEVKRISSSEYYATPTSLSKMNSILRYLSENLI